MKPPLPSLQLLHVTDLHLREPGLAIFDVDPRDRLCECIDDIKSSFPDHDALVFTGDLADEGEAAAYHLLMEILAERKITPLITIGNHDCRRTFLEIFGDYLGLEGAFVQKVKSFGDTAVILLDTVDQGKHAGFICEERLRWLQDRLGEQGDADILLFMHHPPFPLLASRMDHVRLLNYEQFWEVVAPHSAQIKGVYAGHVHRQTSGTWRGLPFMSTPSLIHQVYLQLDAPKVMGVHEPPSYSVILRHHDGYIAHQRFFQQAESRFFVDAARQV